jgi:transcriptional regulator with GAF, ATPase, and Fis domain
MTKRPTITLRHRPGLDGDKPALSAEELHILEHATAWHSERPLYRNHFVTGPNCDNWQTIQGLVERELMRMTLSPGSDLLGGDAVFAVTEAGIALLKPKRKKANELINEAIVKALRELGGNKTRAAKELGLSRSDIYRRLAKMGDQYAAEPVAIQEVE